MTSPAVTERIVEVSRLRKESVERATRLSREVIMAVDQCKSADGLMRADLDAALFTLSELGRTKEQVIGLTAQLRKLRMAD